MFKYFPAIVVLYVLVGCTPPPRYTLIDQAELRSAVETDSTILLKRYVLTSLVGDDSCASLLKVPLVSDYFSIARRSHSKSTERYFSSVAFTGASDTTAKKFCILMDKFLKGSYWDCFSSLKEMATCENSCYLELLRSDCAYEINPSAAYSEVIAFYQKALDCSTDSLFRKIVKARIKLIRYGY
jgi:hypothetical protein